MDLENRISVLESLIDVRVHGIFHLFHYFSIITQLAPIISLEMMRYHLSTTEHISKTQFTSLTLSAVRMCSPLSEYVFIIYSYVNSCGLKILV